MTTLGSSGAKLITAGSEVTAAEGADDTTDSPREHRHGESGAFDMGDLPEHVGGIGVEDHVRGADQPNEDDHGHDAAVSEDGEPPGQGDDRRDGQAGQDRESPIRAVGRRRRRRPGWPSRRWFPQ